MAEEFHEKYAEEFEEVIEKQMELQEEYMENHKAFWGLPKQSSLTSEYIVTSEVEVVDGYGRLQAGETNSTTSKPEGIKYRDMCAS